MYHVILAQDVRSLFLKDGIEDCLKSATWRLLRCKVVTANANIMKRKFLLVSDYKKRSAEHIKQSNINDVRILGDVFYRS